MSQLNGPYGQLGIDLGLATLTPTGGEKGNIADIVANLQAAVVNAGGGSTPLSALPAPVNGVITLEFPTSGNIYYEGTISESVTIAVAGGSTEALQYLTVSLIQDSVGGHTIIWPNSGIIWKGGSPPATNTPGTLPLQPGTYNSFEFATTGTANTYRGNI